MACFHLAWDNSEVLASLNSLTQAAYYRKKGDAPWLNSGFSPDNPLATSDNVTDKCGLDDNVIYQFKIENVCTDGGPTPNDNGMIEQIGFDCGLTVLINDITDTQATIQFDLTDTNITKMSLTLRRSIDNVAVYGPQIVNRSGNTVTAVASGLAPATDHYWQYVLYSTIGGATEVNSAMPAYVNAICGPIVITTNAAPPQDLQWRALATSCEKEGGFNVIKTISGLSSPVNTWYREASNRVYVADYDDQLGNVYWFNPDTATLPAHMTHSAAVQDQELYNNYIDSVYQRIYFVGRNSNGLIVYDILTDTVTTVVAFGSNAAFSRTLLSVSDLRIYCNDGTTSIIIIDRATLAIINTVAIAGIPTPNHFNSGPFTLIEIDNDRIWIASNNSDNNNIGVYDIDLAVQIDDIVLTGVLPWDFSNYWFTMAYDPISQNVLVGDIGSNKRFTIYAPTRVVTNIQTNFNREGKTNSLQTWIFDPITNDLYLAYKSQNTSSDATPNKRLYKETRGSFSYENMFEGKFFSSLIHITGSSRLIGADSGTPFWSNPSDYDDDGSITIVSSTVGADNTGNVAVDTLQEVDANNNDNPTGNTKANVASDPDYIPVEEDLDTCPVVATTDCPTDLVTTFTATTLYYEFALASSVINNPNVAILKIYAYNTSTASTEGLPVVTTDLTPKYFSGTFTGLGGVNYTIRIRYSDAEDDELQIC